MPAAPAAPTSRRYDVVVIGSGPAAGTVVSGLKESGKTVAAVDRRKFGGTCALWGCNSKKVLLNAAKVVDAARRGDGVLVAGGKGVGLDWPRLHAFQTDFTEPVPPGRVEQFRDAGADVFAGLARLTGEDSLAVEPDHADPSAVPPAEPVTLHFEHLVIAAGSVPVPLDIPGAEHLTTSDEFLELPDVPGRVAFVGGGYISLEFAHALLRADREVTVLESSPHILDPFDHVLADRLADRTRDLGAAIHTGVKLSRVERRPDGSLLAFAEREDGPDIEIVCDAVVHGAGRAPAVEALDCGAGGVKAGKKGVETDACLRSVSNPRVFAAGDSCGLGHPMLTPVAEAHGAAVVRFLTTGEPTEPDLSPLPSTTFTEPELAAVGLTPAKADADGVAYRLVEDDLGTKGAYRKRCEPYAGYRILLEPDSDRFVGVHLLGPDSAELINLFAVAMKHGLGLGDLADVPLTYPSLAAEILHDAQKKATRSGATGASKAGLS